MATIPSDWKNCATCAYWLGRQIPDAFCNYVEYDSSEKAKCSNRSGFYNSNTNPMATCSHWVPRFYKK